MSPRTAKLTLAQVYKEKMKDLLRPNSELLRVKAFFFSCLAWPQTQEYGFAMFGSCEQELPQRGLFVDGLMREYVTCASDVTAVIRAGMRSTPRVVDQGGV